MDGSTNLESDDWNVEGLGAFGWEVMSNKLNTKRNGCASVSFNHCIYTIGGNDGNNVLSSVEKYDIRSNQQKNIPSMNFKRSECAAVILENKIFAIGGYDGNDWLDSVEVFDLDGNEEMSRKWVTLPTQMKNKRSGCAAVAFVNQCIYIIGGYDGRKRLSSMEMYDISLSTWLELPSMSSARSYPSAVLADECIYVMGGESKQFSFFPSMESYIQGSELSTMESYNIKTKRWNSALPPMINSRYCGWSVAISNDSFIVMGGESSSGYIANAEAYHTHHKKWISLPDMTIERGYGSGVIVDGSIYVVGGLDGNGNELDLIEKMVLGCLTMNAPPPPSIPDPPNELHSKKRVQALGAYRRELMKINEYYSEKCKRKKDRFNDIVQKRTIENQNKIKKEIDQHKKEIDHHQNMILKLEQRWNENEKKKEEQIDLEVKFEKAFSSWVSEFSKKLEEAQEQIDLLQSAHDRKESCIPAHLLCPITREIMLDPVMASDGFTYEREAISEVLNSSSEPRSPLTNEHFANRNLLQNHSIRSLCQDYLPK